MTRYLALGTMALLLGAGCGRQPTAADVRRTTAPARESKTESVDQYQPRLAAIQQLADEAARMKLLTRIARDASIDKRPDVVRQAIAAVPAPEKNRAMIVDWLLDLAEAGQPAAAVELAKAFPTEASRADALAQLAQIKPASPRAVQFWQACEEGRSGAYDPFAGEAINSSRDHRGETPLMKAAANGHLSLVNSLLFPINAGASDRDKKGETALMKAAASGHVDVVKVLADARHYSDKLPGITQQDNQGRTALMRAAANGHRLVVEVLLAQGAATATRDSAGKTALQHAVENGHQDIATLLQGKQP